MRHFLFPGLILALLLIVPGGCEKDASPESTSDLLLNAAFAGGSSSRAGGGNGGSSTPGVLTAGEWNDLDEWAFWEKLMLQNEYRQPVSKWFPEDRRRYSVRVTSGPWPVINAEVTFVGPANASLWTARTDNAGMAELWVPDQSLLFAGGEIQVLSGGETYTISNPKQFADGINAVDLRSLKQVGRDLDIAFVVDATGSMSDELEYIKAELVDVIQRSGTPGNTRVATTVYRDEGDEYVVRQSEFSADLNVAKDFLDQQHAGGGGDFPEAVHSALETAIDALDWNPEARARLLFLVLDAPPHDSPQIIGTIGQLAKSAAAKGIKIIPVASSGIDKETEFLLRKIEQYTNSTYVFITDDSGIGNPHLVPTVGSYSIEFLNELMIRLISKYSS